MAAREKTGATRSMARPPFLSLSLPPPFLFAHAPNQKNARCSSHRGQREEGGRRRCRSHRRCSRSLLVECGTVEWTCSGASKNRAPRSAAAPWSDLLARCSCCAPDHGAAGGDDGMAPFNHPLCLFLLLLGLDPDRIGSLSYSVL